MFVRYFLNLPFAAQDVEKALLHAPETWIPGVAEDAERHSQVLLAQVGFDASGLRVDKAVELEIASPVRFPSKTILPIKWKATGVPVLFPVMEADIEVAPLGIQRTQLSFSGRYRPPLSIVGRALDRALLHRVAEATAKDFLDRAGEKITSLVGSNGRRAC